MLLLIVLLVSLWPGSLGPQSPMALLQQPALGFSMQDGLGAGSARSLPRVQCVGDTQLEGLAE